MYAPQIKSAKPLRRYRLAPYTFVLLGEIESLGFIEYLYIFFAVKDGTREPCFFVASETNPSFKESGGRACFLGVFDGQGHRNLGASEDWADLDRFASKALQIATAHFDLQGVPAQV